MTAASVVRAHRLRSRKVSGDFFREHSPVARVLSRETVVTENRSGNARE